MNLSSKKGQLGIIELLLVVMVIAIILGLGIYMFYLFFAVDIEKGADELEAQESNVLLAYALNMPELECSTRTSSKNCIDAAKVLAAQTVMKDPNSIGFYNDIFGFRSLSVEVIYPAKTNQACTEANYPDCTSYTLYNNAIPGKLPKLYSVITPLYYPETKTTAIGQLTLGVYPS